jgi:hypothetical protein
VYQRRWYDDQSDVTYFVDQCHHYDRNVLTHVGNGLITVAERHYKLNMSPNLRSLGPMKILGVHKSQNRRREYDRTPAIHRVMMVHFMVPESIQLALGFHMRRLMVTIGSYFAVCQEHQLATEHPDSLEEVQSLIHTYVNEGPDTAERWVWRFKELLLSQLNTELVSDRLRRLQRPSR